MKKSTKSQKTIPASLSQLNSRRDRNMKGGIENLESGFHILFLLIFTEIGSLKAK